MTDSQQQAGASTIQQLLKRNEALEGHATKQKKLIAHLEARVVEIDAAAQRATSGHDQEVARVRANYDSVLTELRQKHAAELTSARATIASLEAKLAGLRAKKT